MKRIIIAVICLVDLVAFNAFMMFSSMIFFHAVLLATPVWAVLWTIFAFDVIWLITLKYNFKYRIVFGFISGFSVYNVLAFLVVKSLGYSNLRNSGIAFLVINSVIQFICVLFVIKFVKKNIKIVFKKCIKKLYHLRTKFVR
ncbi:hypothetical protein IMX26_15675 [Clostridium sp. 'deep sea']|uniref:hypothetical protein n=1 Tax=Clostridium sp. 'deep sea' TaxID=2779445 RepID=UPI00189660AC|nr:hypothetical protein [Clostridium sp. 'deep sea']QOR34880.1 hypothetical protein IMX26_15675 [Clostridium sp. 'deep sea']